MADLLSVLSNLTPSKGTNPQMYDHIKESRPIPSMDAFPGILGDIVKELDPWTDADPIAMMATAITNVSVLLEGKCKVYMGGKWRTPQTNMLAFGPSAVGAKGTSKVYTSMVFNKAFPDWESSHVMVGAPSSGSGLVKRIANMAIKADHLVPLDQFGGEEELEQAISKPWTRLLPGFPVLVYEEELAKVLQRAKMDDQYEPLIRTLWQGGEATAKYGSTGSVTLSQPVVSWLCHITPGEFLARLGRASLSGGTFNRFAILYVKRTRELDWEEPVPDDIINKLSTELRKRIEWATGAAWAHQRAPKVGEEDTRYRMGYSAAYKAYWKSNVHPPLNRMLNGEDPMLSDFAGRARDYVKILAAIFAIMDARTVMEPKDLKAAMAFMQYCLDSLPMIMKELGDNSPVAGKRATIKGDARLAKPAVIRAVKDYLIQYGPTPKGVMTKKLQSSGFTGPDIDNAIVKHNGDIDTPYVTGKVSGRPIILLTWIGATADDDDPQATEPEPLKVIPQEEYDRKVKAQQMLGAAFKANREAQKAAEPLTEPAPTSPRVRTPKARSKPLRATQTPPVTSDSDDLLAGW